MTDTLQALIEAGEIMALSPNTLPQHYTLWKEALKAYRANPPMTVQKAGSFGGSAKTRKQTEARRAVMQKINNKKKAGKK